MATFNEHIATQTKSAKKGEKTIKTLVSSPMMPTGFIYMDYNNGINHIIYDDNEKAIEQYHNIGIMQGSVNGIIAKSNVGKTQLILSIISAMAMPYMTPSLSKYYNIATSLDHTKANTMIIVADAEHTLEMSNFKRIAKMRNRQIKDVVTLSSVTTDLDLIALIQEHAEYKASQMQKIKHPMPDLFGDPIYHYPPTFMVVDSMQSILIAGTENIEGFNKGSNNMAGAQRAKRISYITSLMVEYGEKYNITFFTINHINKKIQTGFMPEPKQFRGLTILGLDSLIDGDIWKS